MLLESVWQPACNMVEPRQCTDQHKPMKRLYCTIYQRGNQRSFTAIDMDLAARVDRFTRWGTAFSGTCVKTPYFERNLPAMLGFGTI